MTYLEQKYNEFLNAFRDAVLTDNVEFTVTKPYNPAYNAEVKYKIGNTTIGICVADRFVCYYNDLVKDIFTEEDVFILNAIIKKEFAKDEDKFNRIAELKKELRELEKEVA